MVLVVFRNTRDSFLKYRSGVESEEILREAGIDM
jgi:hypothetical protein